MIKSYIKIVLRGFRKHKLFTFINVVGLSLGISVAVVIYLIVSYDMTFDRHHADTERIYRVVSDFKYSGEISHSSGVPRPLPDVVKDQVTGLSGTAPVYNYYSFTVDVPSSKAKWDKFKDQQDVAFADERYFDLFSYKWLSGTAKNALDKPMQVVLTAKKAKLYFPLLSYNEILGKQLIYGDSIKTTVTGIVQDVNQNTDLDFSEFISISTIGVNDDLKSDIGGWGNTSSAFQFFVKLSQKQTVSSIERQLNMVLRQQLKKNVRPRAQDKGDVSRLRLQPLTDMHFNADYARYNRSVANKPTIYGLMAVAIFILMLGCVNFINLTTAQATQRAKEIGIRKTMGGSRGQLIRQFLGETFFIVLASVLISVLLVPYLLKTFADIIPSGVKFDVLHQPYILLFLALLSVAITLISGSYPAFLLSGYRPVQVLKSQAANKTNSTRNAVLRKSLTVSQFAISLFFIMATLVVSKQIYYALHKDLGFKKDAIVYFKLPYNDFQANGRRLIMDKLRSVSGIESIGLGAEPPSSYNTNTTSSIYFDGKNETKTQVQRKIGDPNYINVYKLKIIAGRNLQVADTLSGVLINNTYARLLGFNNISAAIGKILEIDGWRLTIVGVLADFHQASLHEPFKPLVFLSDPYNYSTFHVALKPQTVEGSQWQTAITSMVKAWKNAYPDDDLNYRFFDESIAKFYNAEQNTSKMLTWATGLSILISCLGLLGLAVYTTAQRTKEIGVRKVLGASVSQIVTLLSSELVSLIVLAFIITTPIAYYAMHKWIENYADHTTISWWIFALSGIGMLTAGLITLSFQTIKAAVANPVNSLRSE